MRTSETIEIKCNFKHLPKYASFLLSEKLDAFTREQMLMNIEANVPLFKLLSHLSQDELFQISKPNQAEFLSKLQNNNAVEHIKTSTGRWLSDQLPLIGKYDVNARDITLINNSRSKVLKKFLKQYSSDIDILLELNIEIDDLIHIYNTVFIDTYIDLLKEKIEEEENFSSKIIHASPGITFIFDLAKQKEVYITGKVEEVTGFTPEEILEMENIIAEIIHPEDFPIVADLLAKIADDQDGQTFIADYRTRSKDQSFQWMRVYAVVYKRENNGKPLQVIGVCYDVTSEKEIALALQQRERQLLEAQAIGKIGSFEWDVVHDTSISTPELRKILEADRRQTLDEMLSNVHKEDKELLRHSVEEALRVGKLSCEYRYMAKSGEKIIDSKGVVVYNELGEPLKMVGTIQDITERKRIEEHLIQKTLELERSNELLQQFASIASHDLKEPLRKIVLFSNMIITSDWDSFSEGTKNNFQRIVDASKNMQQLIEGILAYSTIQNQTNKENFCLEEAIRQAVSNLEFKVQETDAVIESDGLPVVEVVPYQMQQLFQNLIANAIKFAKKGVRPKVVITHSVVRRNNLVSGNLKPSSSYLKIDVTDNGIGFNNVGSEKIFGLFQRLNSKSAYEGSGLGLAICKRIVEYHGGTIQAFSQEGEGSTFTVILPYSN